MPTIPHSIGLLLIEISTGWPQSSRCSQENSTSCTSRMTLTLSISCSRMRSNSRNASLFWTRHYGYRFPVITTNTREPSTASTMVHSLELPKLRLDPYRMLTIKHSSRLTEQL
ncbi:hypothetical protein PENTCL1PPCAC_15021 [Pristionchus entomophagus]|uniref:Secreted protein n=1 Tax=Pristionchus entomophagus TaxID=358040 RepID=A0AAV5TBB2_9BILA|nr:hypothetical protein PENTCL1PPCAC_15021 [Pristionchus entomophagus]